MPKRNLSFAVPCLPAGRRVGRDPTTPLIAALGDAGHAVTQTSVASTAEVAVWLASLASAPETVPVIDGLVLPYCVGVAEHPAISGAVGLLHRAPLAAMPVLARLARIVATSPAVATRIVEILPDIASRIVVIPPGFDAAPRTQGSDDGVCRLISVGALKPRKGHQALLHALARLADLDWCLAIIGDPACDPEHAARLHAAAAMAPLLGRVSFAGNVEAARLDAHWAASDIFVLPSSFEAGFTTLGEALRRGLPAVIGVPSTMLPPDAGIVCAQDDPVTLSKVLRRLIFDRALRRTMAEAAWTAGGKLPDWPMAAESFVLRGIADTAQHERSYG